MNLKNHRIISELVSREVLCNVTGFVAALRDAGTDELEGEDL